MNRLEKIPKKETQSVFCSIVRYYELLNRVETYHKTFPGTEVTAFAVKIVDQTTYYREMLSLFTHGDELLIMMVFSLLAAKDIQMAEKFHTRWIEFSSKGKKSTGVSKKIEIER